LHSEALPGPVIDGELLQELLDALSEHEVTGEIVRVVDCNIKPGVSSDEGEGDAWPQLRQRIVDSAERQVYERLRFDTTRCE
jgi:hypothetical protein